MDMNSSRILLSGASGMLGSALRGALRLRDAKVLQLVRREPEAENQLAWNPAGVAPVPDPSRVEGCAAAVHLSGANVAGRRWTPEYKAELRASRVDSTRALSKLLAGLKHPPRTLLVASAIGYSGDRVEEMLDENSTPGAGFLPDLCQQWEAAARPAADAGIRVVHLRFGVVLGPREGALARMLPIFRLGLGGKMASGRQWISWISIDDAVAAMLYALDTQTLGGPLNLTTPSPVTNAEFTRALAQQLKRPAILAVPAFAIRMAFGEMAEETLLASARVFPRRLQSAGFRFKQPVLAQALAAVLQTN